MQNTKEMYILYSVERQSVGSIHFTWYCYMYKYKNQFKNNIDMKKKRNEYNICYAIVIEHIFQKYVSVIPCEWRMKYKLCSPFFYSFHFFCFHTSALTIYNFLHIFNSPYCFQWNSIASSLNSCKIMKLKQNSIPSIFLSLFFLLCSSSFQMCITWGFILISNKRHMLSQ